MSRKLRSRITITLAFIICCVVIGAFFYAQLNLKEKTAKTDLFTLVPQNAQAIIETNNITSLFQTLEATPFQKDYEQLHFSDLFNFLNHKIDELAEVKGHGLSVPMSNVLISFHAPGNAKDQTLYGHLGNGDQSLIDNILKELNTTGHTPKETKYKGQKIIVYPLNNREFLACFFQANSYAISFQKKLIESVVDAYVDKQSILSDTLFAQVYQQKKSENNVRLYARTMPIADWTQYDIHLQGDAIYLAGNCFQKEAKGKDRFPLVSNVQVPILSADFLPIKTRIFYQMGIQNVHNIVNTLAYNDSVLKSKPYSDAPLHKGFYQFLEDYALSEIDLIEFQGKDTAQSHRVMLFPMQFDHKPTLEAWKNIARPTFRKVWHKGHGYTFYTFPNNRLLKYLLSERAAQADKLTGILNEQYLILSDREEDIRAYLNQHSYTEIVRLAWNEYLNDLAQQANFTFFADMEDIYQRPQEFTSMLPPFFFNHLDFFRQFTLTIQFIQSDGPLNTNIILNYKSNH